MKGKTTGHREKLERWGLLFVSPFVIVYCVFSLWPTIYTFILSFGNLKGLRTDFQFAGLVNFSRLVKDVYFWGAIKNTFIISWCTFFFQLGIALLLSVWLSDTHLNLKGKSAFRAIIYMPNLFTAASMSLLFRSLFLYPTGPLSKLLYTLGIHQDVMVNSEMVRQAVNLFRSAGFTRGLVSFIYWLMWYGHTNIILMAGITGISSSLYESALVDGASSRQTTWYITLPLLRPIMLYVFITSMIGGMQAFDIPALLTEMRGNPDFKARTTVMYLYNVALQGNNDYSYGAAISIGMFVITIVLALIIFFFLQDRSELKKTRA
ncbi:MAG: sugar ABC transporter permease [Spirochaetaceae bacterium]|jgi:multiple sugar transport system permease protein|nr:sugar ABC transporter permease [Spirochaetaceae bacterium]